MCSGSDAGSYLRRIDFVYQSTLALRVIKKNTKTPPCTALSPPAPPERRGNSFKGFRDFYLKAKALTVLYVPYSLGSGLGLSGGRGGASQLPPCTAPSPPAPPASGFRVESGPLRAVHVSRHKWPGGLGHLLSSQGCRVKR